MTSSSVQAVSMLEAGGISERRAKMGQPTTSVVTQEDPGSPTTISLRKDLAQSTVCSEEQQQQVVVDSRHILPKCQLPPQQELEAVETFVAEAITNKTNNSNTTSPSYRALLECIRKKQEPNMFHKVLLALRTSGNTLTLLTTNSRTHAHLLHLIFKTNPFVPPLKLLKEHEKDDQMMFLVYQDYSMADAFLNLVVAIVSANSVFLTPILTALWKLLAIPNAQQEEQESTSERTFRLHAAIATILRLVPKGTTELFPIISCNFPFRTAPRQVLVWYAQQCWAVLDYLPHLCGPILAVVVDKCLEMDVEIKINDGGEASIEREDSSSSDNDGMFDLDLDDDEELPLPADDDEYYKVDEMADRLDALMLLSFEHVTDMVKRDHVSAKAVFDMLLPIFESNILTTYKSKYVQFLLFLVCGADPNVQEQACVAGAQLYREFAEKLIGICYNHFRATVTRQTAACYLASFVSRATYVCPETVCESISALLRWAEAYIAATDLTMSNDARNQCEHHSLFYTVCQASFYIMCFRGKDAIKYYQEAVDYHANRTISDHDDDDEELLYPDLEHIDLSKERWVRICSHEFQPLRFCLESVRQEFLHVAHVFEFFDASLLEKLAKDAKRISSGYVVPKKRPRGNLICTPAALAKRRLRDGVGGMGAGSNPLDSFFPFDPYLLRRSHRYVDSLYKNWEGSIEEDAILEDVEDDEEIEQREEESDEAGSDDDDDDDDDNDEEDNEHMPMSVNSNNTLSTSKSSMPSGSMEVSSSIQQYSTKEAWANTMKRTRGYSIESGGSW